MLDYLHCISISEGNVKRPVNGHDRVFKRFALVTNAPDPHGRLKINELF